MGDCSGSYNSYSWSFSFAATAPLVASTILSNIASEDFGDYVVDALAEGLEINHADDEVMLDITSVEGTGIIINFVYFVIVFSILINFCCCVTCACCCADACRPLNTDPESNAIRAYVYRNWQPRRAPPQMYPSTPVVDSTLI